MQGDNFTNSILILYSTQQMVSTLCNSHTFWNCVFCLPCFTDNRAIHTCTNTADLGFILYIFRINIKAFDNEFSMDTYLSVLLMSCVQVLELKRDAVLMLHVDQMKN